ncbi:glycosyltransferase family 9 protein [uncultured Eudoraea sp.]|uniref:glycosyltransferase family 9 protein n=1 Tax=uncultured Eudoraea sp. TaxID=1035614 RepID=UPI00260592F9|nr:glycosyltransferase family 9 protein [uncultured Eudoraea sp.]
MGKSKFNHLLVIRLSAMGDVAMIVPVLSALNNQFPHLKVTVLTKAFFSPLFEQLSNVNVYEADVNGKHKGILGLWKLFKELNGLGIDAVADLHNVLRSSILRGFFRSTKIPFVQIDKGRKEKRALTAHKNKVFMPLKSTFQRYADVFDKLGYPLNLEFSSPKSKAKLSEKALQLVGKDNLKWIGIAPFATYPGKMYPRDLMEEIIATLNNTKKYKILIFGGGKLENEIVKDWSASYQNCINTIGKLSFREELGLISNLDLMLSMDSGNGHLAAIYDIPTVTLWGVTHPYAGFAPFNQPPENSLLSDRTEYPLIPTSVYGNKMPEGYANVMSTIEPDSVIQLIRRILETD